MSRAKESSTGRPVAAISVVIPVKDRLWLLKQTVESVFQQTVLPHEVVIIDDFSVEPVTVELFGSDLPVAVRIFRNEPNLGAALAANIGLAEAKCSVVAFLDSDDCFRSDYIEKIWNAWQSEEPLPVCIVAGFYWCDDNLKPYRAQIPKSPITFENLLRKGNRAGGCSVLSVDRSTALSVGGYPSVRGSYDWGFLLRLSKIGRVVSVPYPLLLYRSPSASSVPNDTKNYRRQIISLAKLLREQQGEHRRIALPIVLLLISYNLAQMNRRRLSLSFLGKSLLRGAPSMSLLMRTALVLAVGEPTFSRLLKGLIGIRRSFRSLIS